MGKFIEMLAGLRGMSHMELLARYKHIVRAQAIREYLAAKADKMLDLEVNLASEEIVSRMSRSSAVSIIPDDTNDQEG